VPISDDYFVWKNKKLEGIKEDKKCLKIDWIRKIDSLISI